VVDAVLYSTFADLTDEAVSADPLVVLSCGHVFAASTLDGHTQLASRFYVRGERPPAAKHMPLPGSWERRH
jgi:hypothetical protein